MERGLVFNIKRFAVHDGDGVRTTVFVKGCPLRCRWCHNPEGLEMERRIWHIHAKCMSCGECLAVCPSGALYADNSAIRFDAQKCIGCGKCVPACPTGAQSWDSDWMTVDEVMHVIERDRLVYETSGGGMTVSGGDPLHAQRAFVLALLRACKEKGIHTTVESCLHAPWDAVAAFAEVVDQFIVDIKIMDSTRHREYTGLDNALILENIRALARLKKPLLIRTPMIPGCTDDLENIAAIAAFIASLDAPETVRAEILNFNPLYSQKYEHRNTPVQSFGGRLSKEEMLLRQKIYLNHGIHCIFE